MMRRSRLAKRGFTLVELVAVTTSVSLMMSLAFPALQKARQDARAVQCQNNLKQLGLALHNYHDVYVGFAPGWVLRDMSPKAGPSFAWSAKLLPFVEQAPLYNELDVGNAPSLSPPRLYRTPLEVFRCPADEAPARLKERGGFGTSNYVGNYGVELISDEEDAAPTSGFFYLNSMVRIRDIIDGTSNTIMVGERGASTGAAIWAIVRTNAQAEDAVASSNDEKRINTAEGAYSSAHDGGAFFLFGDGAVRFVSEDIDSSKEVDPPQGMFQRLSIIDDRQVVKIDE